MSAVSNLHVVVIGSGFAGLSAAHAAHDRGATVTIVRGGAGASALYAGAADDDLWDEVQRAAARLGTEPTASAIDADVESLCRDLGLWVMPAAGAPLPIVATTAGIARTARAHDAALLDLRRAEGRTVLVPRADRSGWDADSIVRCLGAASAPASDRPASFEAISAPVLRFDEERDIVDADLAARHDDPARLEWLAKNLGPEVARRGKDRVAILLGPWLGASRSRAAELSARLGVPTGEALAAASGTAGQRYEAARDAFFDRIGIRTVSGWAENVSGPASDRHGCVVSLGEGRTITCDVVVVATGGVLGGGVRYEPPDHAAPAEGAKRITSALRLVPHVDGVRLSLGLDVGPSSSTHGPVLDERAWPFGSREGAIERAGVLVDASGRAAPRVFAGGDVTFGHRRTVLTAMRSGLDAGRCACEAALVAREPNHQLLE
ncbi:MAG: FAD-binding protein [Polyangiaceae bacterium]|nr:FAD-binding protein [Polyangiaceae bacterium]